MVIKNGEKKTGPNSSVEPPVTDMSSDRHQAEVRGLLGFESELAAGPEEVKT